MSKVTPTIVRDLLDYNPETGVFLWRHRANAPSSWNSMYRGTVALNSTTRFGYLRGSIFNASVKSHRIAWMHYYGVAPFEVDHINGNRSDNRIANLREVKSRSENLRNMGMKSNNTSGVMGVCWDAHTKKWKAEIRVNGKGVNLGRFASIDDAANARALANVKYGYHENHGMRPGISLQSEKD